MQQDSPTCFETAPELGTDHTTTRTNGETMTPEQQQAMQAEIYKTIRMAVAHELLTYHEATIVPMLNSINEMQQSLRLLLDGQVLVEKTLANMGDDGESWKGDDDPE